jgi:phosphohistidine phosphatase
MNLELYFMRHARAVSRTDWYGDDSARPLTERGREDAARMAGFIAKLGLPVDAIVTSPYARALETADIMARHLNITDKLLSDDRVAPGFDVKGLDGILQDYPDPAALILVGHEPDFSRVIGRMVGGRVVMKKGGIAYIEYPEASGGKATLGWLVQPSVLGV